MMRGGPGRFELVPVGGKNGEGVVLANRSFLDLRQKPARSS